MRYPKPLEKGGTIGFVAPSFGCTTEPYKTAFDNTLKKLRDMGYKTLLGPNCYKNCGIGISNTPEECGKELNDFYTNASADVLFSCGGGECMCEILPFLDLEALKEASPKWYMGYSDNTNFTFISTTILDTAAVYGPCANEFGMEPWHPAIEDAMSIVTGSLTSVHNYDGWEEDDSQGRTEDRPLAPYNITKPYAQRVWLPDHGFVTEGHPSLPVKLEGRLAGGCVDCLVTLLGTRFDRVKDFNRKYEKDGIIWFLECCDLNTMQIRRAMWQMREAGWFDTAKGFLVGRPLNGTPFFNTDQYAAVTDILGQFNVPVLMDLDIGHLSPMMPIISGACAEVNAGANEIEIRYLFK